MRILTSKAGMSCVLPGNSSLCARPAILGRQKLLGGFYSVSPMNSRTLPIVARTLSSFKIQATSQATCKNRSFSSPTSQQQSGVGNIQAGGDVVSVGGGAALILAAMQAWRKREDQYPSLANFSVYREKPLEKIENLFAQQGMEKPIVAILGDTTKGKTELAKQYVKRHSHKYHYKWFLNAKNWKSEYRNLALAWKLVIQAEKDTLPDEIIVKKVHDVFSERRIFGSKSLIVFDDAPEGFIEDSLKGMLPSNTDILVTAQRGIFEHRINLTLDESLFLTEEEGLAIFVKTFKNQEPLNDAEKRDIRKIVQQFKNLPVAIAQAAHYLQENRNRIGSYLDIFEKNKKEVLKQGKIGEIDIYVSILMNIKAIEKDFPTAILFLYYCTLLPNEKIPKELLERLTQGPLELDSLLKKLQVWIIPDKETVSLHRTLQAILQEILEKDMAQERNAKKEGLSKLGKLALDFVPFLAQNPSKAEVIYLQAIQDEEQKATMDPLRIAALFSALGNIQHQLLKYSEALKAHQKALSINKEYLEDDHSNIVTNLNNAGIILNKIGKYEEALKYFKEALKLRKKLFGNNHPDVATSLNNVGSGFRSMGQYAEALKYQKEALELSKKLLGDNHPDVATNLNNVSTTLWAMGQYVEALKYQKEALELFKKLFGDNHLDVATSLNNMGATLGKMGQYAEALKHQKEALELKKKLLGDNHPDVATGLNNVGEALRDMGQYTEALKHQKEALEFFKKLFGDNHAHVSMSLNNVGVTLRKMGRHAEALKYHKEALELRKKILGDSHPHTAMSLSNVGITFGDMEIPNTVNFSPRE